MHTWSNHLPSTTQLNFDQSCRSFSVTISNNTASQLFVLGSKLYIMTLNHIRVTQLTLVMKQCELKHTFLCLIERNHIISMI